jgi:hypothetical protein
MGPKKALTHNTRSGSTSGNADKTQEGKKEDADPPAPCGSCKKLCVVDDKALECELCNTWFHASCQDISDQMYNVIIQDSNSPAPLLHWYCKPACSKLATNVIDSLVKIRSEVGKLGLEMEGMKSRVQNIEDGHFTPAMQDAVKSIAAVGDGAAAPAPLLEKEEILKLVEEKAKEHSQEVEDRVRRSKNIVIFGVPESASKDSQENRKENITKAEQILTEAGLTHKPTDTRRLGNFVPNAARPRPLRVSFSTQAARDEALQAFRKTRSELRNEGQEENRSLLASISVRKDLTPTERKEEEVLYRQLREKQEESKAAGDDNARWIRKNGKIMNIGRYPPKHQGENKEGE